jgi:hypothetical protein
MSVSDFVNVPSLIGSAFGATVFGWLGAYVAVKGKNFATRADVKFLHTELRENTEIVKSVDQKFSRSDVLWRGELAFRQQQLAELYGPLYGLLQSQEEMYWLWMEGKMNEKNLDIKQLFSTHNEKIRELMVSKAHLIEGSVMPESFKRFSTCTLIFDLYAATTNEGEVPPHLKADPRAAYPLDFNDHIYRVTEALKARIETLNAEYAPPLKLADRASSTGAPRN